MADKRIDLPLKNFERIWELMHEMGNALVGIVPGIQSRDGGQEAVLESTNHADRLRELKQSYDEYRLDTDDFGPGEDYPGDEAILAAREGDK